MIDPDLISRAQSVPDQMLERIGEELRLATTNAATVNLDQASVGRLSRMDALQQQAMAQASVQRLAIQQRRVEATLVRVSDGGYGICSSCACEIGLERLLSDPATPFCIECQKERNAAR